MLNPLLRDENEKDKEREETMEKDEILADKKKVSKKKQTTGSNSPRGAPSIVHEDANAALKTARGVRSRDMRHFMGRGRDYCSNIVCNK